MSLDLKITLIDKSIHSKTKKEIRKYQMHGIHPISQRPYIEYDVVVHKDRHGRYIFKDKYGSDVSLEVRTTIHTKLLMDISEESKNN